MSITAITNGHLLTITGQSYEKGTVVFQDGKITALGNTSEVTIPEGVTVVDATGKYVLPGFIDAHTHVGIGEEGIGWEGEDYNDMTDPITPHLRAIDAINPEDQGFRDALSGGITSVMVNPGSANVIGGQTVALKTFGRTVDEMVLREPAGLKAALGENPKRVYRDQKKMPTTRMGSAALLRETFVRAQNYLTRLDAWESAGSDEQTRPFERDIRLEAVGQVLRRAMPLRLHAHRADDILTALRIQEEFGFDLTIEHCTEGHKIADILAARKIPAMVGPIITSRSKVELRDRAATTAATLVGAGVKVAIITDHSVVPIQHFIIQVILAVRAGLDPDEALRAITINPAEIMGVADRVGSLEVGKDADIIVLSRHPLDAMAKVERAFVSGELAYSE